MSESNKRRRKKREERQREKQEERRKAGLCLVCGKRPPADKGRMCAACRERVRLTDEKRRKENRAKGLCVQCGKQLPEDTGPECATCHARAQLAGAKLRKGRKAKRLCHECGKKLSEDDKGTRCSTCRARAKRDNAKRRKERTDKGLCPCGSPTTPERKTCERCQTRTARFKAKIKDEVFAAYGGYKCACCGETHKEFLQIDHVNNDGAEHRRKIGGSGRLYGWLKKHGFPQEGFQVLCLNCNWAKRLYGYCRPHQDDSHREVKGVQRTGRRPLADCLP